MLLTGSLNSKIVVIGKSVAVFNQAMMGRLLAIITKLVAFNFREMFH